MTVFKKEDKQTSTFRYEIQIYFGEKLNDDKTSDNYGDVIKSDKTKSIFVNLLQLSTEMKNLRLYCTMKPD